MYFNVSQLLKEPNGSTRAYPVDEQFSLKDAAQESRVAGEVSMLRTDRGIWVSAALDTKVQSSCSRCLADVEQPVHMDIEEEYLPEIDVNTGARLNVPDEQSENFYINHNHILSLAEAVNQYLDMNTPMKPVCSDSCKGICLTCGIDLNENTCTCDNDQIDPRWGPLVELVAPQHPENN